MKRKLIILVAVLITAISYGQRSHFGIMGSMSTISGINQDLEEAPAFGVGARGTILLTEDKRYWLAPDFIWYMPNSPTVYVSNTVSIPFYQQLISSPEFTQTIENWVLGSSWNTQRFFHAEDYDQTIVIPSWEQLIEIPGYEEELFYPTLMNVRAWQLNLNINRRLSQDIDVLDNFPYLIAGVGLSYMQAEIPGTEINRIDNFTRKINLGFGLAGPFLFGELILDSNADLNIRIGVNL